MTTHDFRPGDVVEILDGDGEWRPALVKTTSDRIVFVRTEGGGAWSIDAADFPQSIRHTTRTEHPSRSRAASSLRAASASLTTAIDHLTRAGEAETYPGQTVIRIRTAAEETQACIHHATMALYWLLHERLGS